MVTYIIDKIQVKRANAITWTNLNPILDDGETGFERDTNKLKIGNGVDNWATLDYIGVSGALSDLSDVTSSTPTSSFVLIGNGSSFASRALLMSDISDYSITSVVDAITAQLGHDRWEGIEVPAGGTAGQVLRKNSGTNYDYTWGSTSGFTGDAGDIPFTPQGGIAASDVEGALVELDTEKAAASHTHVLTNITDVTATFGELNLLDLSGLTAGWVLSADTASTASWKAPTGTIAVSGTPVTDDYARWTDANTIEGRSYAEVRTDLGLVIGTNVQAYSAALDSVSGSNTGDQTITLTGDVTGTGTGSFATTIAAGSVDIAMLSASGTASGSTYLRGDNTWATVAGGGGDMVKVGTPVNNQIGVWTGDGTMEGTTSLVFDGTTFDIAVSTRLPDNAILEFGNIQDAAIAFDASNWVFDLLSGSGDIIFSQSTVTRITFDMDTGNISTTGTVDGVDIAALASANTGDQTTIVGISGTRSQFDTAVTDGDIVYIGDSISIDGATSGAATIAVQAVAGTPTLTLPTTTGTIALTSDITGTNSGTNTGDQTSIVGITGTKAQFDTAVTDGNFMYTGDAPTSHTHTLSDVTDVTATFGELNLLDLSGLTAGWVLSADSATTASWKAAAGGLSASGTPVNNQVGVWTSSSQLEGSNSLLFDGSTFTVTGITDLIGNVGVDATGTTKAAPRTVGFTWTGSGSTDAVWLQFGDAGNGIFYSDGGLDQKIGYHPSIYRGAVGAVGIPTDRTPGSETGRSSIFESSVATRTALTARGFTSQSVPIFEVEVVGKTDVFSVDASGNVIVSGTVDGVDIDALSTTVGLKANSASPTFTGTVVIPSTFTIGANNFVRSGAHSLTLTTTATTNVTLPTTGTLVTQAGTSTLTNKTLTDAVNTVATPTTTSVGYLGIPQNSKSAAYTLVLADAGKHILHPSADTTARTFTIPANSSVAFPIGTAVTFINQNAGGVITIAITTDTMRLAGPGTTGSRTLAANGIATAVKVTSTEWLISGTNLT